MSYLVIGGTAEERKQKATEISNFKFQISNFDTISITGETSIGIGEIRELEHNLSLKPYNSSAKAAIIHPGELLTTEAQNALLKTLEETSENTIIILTAPQSEFLLPTVVSRCQIIRLPLKSEIILSDEEFNALYLILNTLYQNGVGERLKIASEIGKQKEEITDWLEKLLYFLHVNMLTRYETKLNLPAGQLVKIIRNLEKSLEIIEQNINPRLVLEVFLLDLP